MKRTLASFLLLASSVVAADTPRVYIEPSETVDTSSKAPDKATRLNFGSAIAAALTKKKVPVVVVTDPGKSQWTIRSVSSQWQDTTGTKVAKMLFGFGLDDFTHFEGAIQVIDNESSAVLYAYNVKKDNFQAAAEAFAKHFKGDYLAKRSKQ